MSSKNFLPEVLVFDVGVTPPGRGVVDKPSEKKCKMSHDNSQEFQSTSYASNKRSENGNAQIFGYVINKLTIKYLPLYEW